MSTVQSASASGRAATGPAEGQLKGVAEHTLSFFSAVAAGASEQLGEKRPDARTALAVVNTLTADRAVRKVEAVSEARKKDLLILTTEPAIARVVAIDDEGKTKTYFIARGTPDRAPPAGCLIASYRSPLGRLASLPVGGDLEITTKAGSRSFEVVGHAALHPKLRDGAWDSTDSVVAGKGFGPFTVKSFLDLLRSTGAIADADFLDAILAEDRAAANVVEGLRRAVIAKMELRDQPLLDRYQDEIFRLPITTCLVILGPPGTGKTTTLIKRLGLKLDINYLSDDEREQVRLSVAGEAGHSQSWIMFTPTDLLQQYVKEAFAKEEIPASVLRIQTWADHRRELARNRFGFLRKGTGTASAVMKEALPSLRTDTLGDQAQWFEDFQKWQAEAFWTDLKEQAHSLGVNADASVARIGRTLSDHLHGGVSGMGTAAFVAISAVGEQVQAALSRLKAETDAQIRDAITRELGRDRTLLDQLVTFLGTLEDSDDESEDQDGEDDEELRQPKITREVAYHALARTLKAQARAAVSGRSLSRQSRSGKIAEWLGARKLPMKELRSLGESLQIQGSMRRFANPIRRYFDGLPLRYRRFRQERQAEARWYAEGGFATQELSPLEVDVILLAIMRGMRALLQDRRIFRDFEQGRHPTLESMGGLFRTQVAVDEATDFSPVQLACMNALTDPATNAFVACGDFNQRITEWGSRSEGELAWAAPGLELRPINISYRHSRQLNELARSIALLSRPDAPETQLPSRVDNEGVAPVLALGLRDPGATAAWLAERIVEIERFTQLLPSVAVLVSEEELVVPLAEMLSTSLADRNIRAVPCPRGNLAGRDNDVRVFDVQHIKGLEFEAVFFVGVNRLADTKPELFDKYLYVGATRAAMYLGVTSEEETLPDRIASLVDRFGRTWS